jgi:hypothetical protein
MMSYCCYSPTKTNMLVLFLQCAHPGNVKKGFFAGGVIDLKSEVWPDFYAMMNTCKKRNADKHLCLEEFARLPCPE